MAEIPETPFSSGLPEAVNDRWSASLGSLLFLAAIFLINFLSRIIFGPLLVVMEQDLRLGHQEAGGLFLIITTGYSLSLLGSGYLANRLSHRRIIVLSALGMGMALFILSQRQPLWGIQAGLFLLGLTAGHLFTLRDGHLDFDRETPSLGKGRGGP